MGSSDGGWARNGSSLAGNNSSCHFCLFVMPVSGIVVSHLQQLLSFLRVSFNRQCLVFTTNAGFDQKVVYVTHKCLCKQTGMD